MQGHPEFNPINGETYKTIQLNGAVSRNEAHSMSMPPMRKQDESLIPGAGRPLRSLRATTVTGAGTYHTPNDVPVGGIRVYNEQPTVGQYIAEDAGLPEWMKKGKRIESPLMIKHQTAIGILKPNATI